MSGFRVPVFFGSILTLVVLVLQNRTPVFQLTLLGIRSRPFSLGMLVTMAVISGVILGAILQRTGPRRSRSKPQPRPYQSTDSYAGPTEYQPLHTVPDVESADESEAFNESDMFSSSPKAKGWDSGVSKSWAEQAEQVEEEGRFWSRPRKTGAKRGTVTPIKPNRSQESTSTDDTPSVFDAEYRIVPPTQRDEGNGTQRDEGNGFDDNFFDDFFDEEET